MIINFNSFFILMLIPEVYDIETLNNLFTYTGYNIETNKWYQFVIHKDLNQVNELYRHLSRGNFFQIGFNNDNFDYPILHYFILNYKKKFKYCTGFEIANDLYQKAQELINSTEYHGISEKNKFIFQLDLFKIWHYNNKARRTSLKDLEFAMNMDIQEMPISHEQLCSKSDINLVLSYNKHDVEATVKFYKTTLGDTDYCIYKGKNKLTLRSAFKKMFNISCYNWPDVKIGEQLMLTLYCRETNSDPNYIRTLRTKRDIINLKDCIPYWCNIKSKEFQEFYNLLKITSIKPGSKSFSKTIIYHGIGFDFALGGSHGCIKSGIYKSDNEWVILDLDIGSLYPSIAKSLNLYPEHLGKSFNHLYTQFIDVRLKEKHKPKNERNNALIEGYKLLLNGTYGKSGEETSFLYDPLYTYKTTIAGQCFICMWAERMVEVCPELIFIQINTDGITIKVPRNKVNNIKNVCFELEKLTGLSSEFVFYKQMIIRDVNNYIAEYDDSTKENEHLKLKGCFEIYKEYHKDPSMRIVPIALKEYFINGVSFNDTLKFNNNIYDYCIRLKINHTSKAIYSTLVNNIQYDEELSRTTRYYASNNGGKLTVYYNNSTSPTRLNQGYSFQLFNKFYKSDNYNIDYSFYLSEINKIYYSIVDNQLTLF